MIESDIKKIKSVQKAVHTKTAKQLTKTAKQLKKMESWQLEHEQENNRHFADITALIGKLPTEEAIKIVIADNIKLVVNGKIDNLSTKVDLVGEHLKRQDTAQELSSTAIEELTQQVTEQGEQIKPWNRTYIFGVDAVKVIVYCGTVAGALAAIIGFLYLVGWIKN